VSIKSDKFGIKAPNNKKQMTNKFQISMIKTCPYGCSKQLCNYFGHWIFEHWNLFEIWCLSFVIFNIYL